MRNQHLEASATTAAQFVSNGFEQDLTGNQMPFADMTLSLGIAYTAQVGNLITKIGLLLQI